LQGGNRDEGNEYHELRPYSPVILRVVAIWGNKSRRSNGPGKDSPVGSPVTLEEFEAKIRAKVEKKKR
jgi:hypothetical protein